MALRNGCPSLVFPSGAHEHLLESRSASLVDALVSLSA